MSKKHITVKPRSRMEFCRLFLDESYSTAACYYWLSHEIEGNLQLKNELLQLGYKKGSHYLTIPQQDCILRHFGVQ